MCLQKSKWNLLAMYLVRKLFGYKKRGVYSSARITIKTEILISAKKEKNILIFCDYLFLAHRHRFPLH